MTTDAPYGRELGEIVDERYELSARIGRGGLAEVYRAVDSHTQQDVAIKFLRPKVAGDEKQRARLKREARVMGQLAGTCAVEVMDVREHSDGGMYLVMEYLEGKDLGSLLRTAKRRKMKLPTPALVEIFDPIVDTLQLAHERQIIHRDLKPTNIFVLPRGARGRVRLLDFGMAKDLSEPGLTDPGTVTGSPPYIAPEAWKGKPELLDQRVDVFGLGALLYRVLAGRLPFEPGATFVSLVLAIMRGPRPKLTTHRPDLPIEVDHWTETVLAIDPDDRFSSVRAAWTALKQVLPT